VGSDSYHFGGRLLRNPVRIPMMSISHSDLMPISSDRQLGRALVMNNNWLEKWRARLSMPAAADLAHWDRRSLERRPHAKGAA
jgi:hypothetical protein